MSQTKTNNDQRIRWRGHPTSFQARGRCEALRAEISVHDLHDKGKFGIYLGGQLQEALASPIAPDEPNVRPYRDMFEGYRLAKERAQALVPAWVERDLAEHAKRADQERARQEREREDERGRWSGERERVRALELATELAGGLGDDPNAVELARLVLELLTPEG